METLHPLQRFWLLLKPDKREIRNVYVYAVFKGLVNLSLPIGIQAIINLIQGGRISTSWILLVCFVIIGIAITGLLHVSQMRIAEHLQQKIFARAAFEFAYRIPRVRLEALYRHYAPELMNRFFDVISVQKGLAKILIDFSTASIQVVFGLILLSLYHPFFIAFGLILVALVYGIFKLTARRGLDTSLEESKRKYRVANWLEELARTSTSFKLAGTTELPMERVNESVDEYIDARQSHFTILVQQYVLMIGFKVLVATGLLAIGGWLVMEQEMNIGQFVAAEIIILLVMNAVEKLIVSLESVYDTLTSLEKIGQVTDFELEDDNGVDAAEVFKDGGLEVHIKNIFFKYPDQAAYQIEDVSLHIKPGEKLLVNGNTESGKSTLLYLMAGLYQLQSGTISYNGLPYRNFRPETLRGRLGDCLMDELLFEGSILENISMGRADATFENVQWAIEKVGLSQFVQTLPQGYNTVIYPQGARLSSGTIAKLLLARSIADRPQLLLIKDAFTMLQDEERERLFDFLTADDMPWTLVIASVDPYLETRVDRVVTLVKGKIFN